MHQSSIENMKLTAQVFGAEKQPSAGQWAVRHTRSIDQFDPNTSVWSGCKAWAMLTVALFMSFIVLIHWPGSSHSQHIPHSRPADSCQHSVVDFLSCYGHVVVDASTRQQAF